MTDSVTASCTARACHASRGIAGESTPSPTGPTSATADIPTVTGIAYRDPSARTSSAVGDLRLSDTSEEPV